MSETFIPFSNGTQAMDWEEANCNRCTKGARDTGKPEAPACPIQFAIAKAWLTDGRVSMDIAQRMGALDHKGYYNWKCNEWEPTETWKKEWRVLYNRSYSGKLGPWVRGGCKGIRYLDVGYQGKPDYRRIDHAEKDGPTWRYLRLNVEGVHRPLVRWCNCNIYE